MTNYSMHGRTYKYMRAEPLLPFGYGLSYTLFEYHKAVISPRVYYGCETIMVDVELENVGAMGGDEVGRCGSVLKTVSQQGGFKSSYLKLKFKLIFTSK